jgi:hypothetical protein
MNACRRVGADVLGDLGAAGDSADDAGGTVPVQSPPARSGEQRPVGALADRQVNCAGSPGCERDGDDLAALADDELGAVAGFQAQVLDVGTRGLGRSQSVEREQGDERVLGGRAGPGGYQEGAEFVAVQGGGVRLIIEPGTANVRCWRVLEEFFLDGVLDDSSPSASALLRWFGACFPTRGESIWIEFRRRSCHERSPSHQGSSPRRAPRRAAHRLHPCMVFPGGKPGGEPTAGERRSLMAILTGRHLINAPLDHLNALGEPAFDYFIFDPE